MKRYNNNCVLVCNAFLCVWSRLRIEKLPFELIVSCGVKSKKVYLPRKITNKLNGAGVTVDGVDTDRQSITTTAK